MGGVGGGGGKRARPSSALSAKVQNLQRKVALLRPETKVLNTLVNVNNITTAGSVTYLTAHAQALTDAGRIGDKIRVTGISGMVSVYSGALAATGVMYSIFVIKDNDSNGVVPSITGTAESIFTDANPRTAFAQTGTSGRYKILARKDFGSNSVYLGGPQSGTYQKFNIKLNNVLTYRDTTAAQTAAGKNALYMVIITDDGSNTVDVVCPCSITYTDV